MSLFTRVTLTASDGKKNTNCVPPLRGVIRVISHNHASSDSMLLQRTFSFRSTHLCTLLF